MVLPQVAKMAIAGVSVGVLCLGGGALLRRRKPAQLETVDEETQEVLAKGRDNVLALVSRLETYGRLEPDAFGLLVEKLTELVQLRLDVDAKEVPLSMGLPGRAARMGGQVVRALRVMRARSKRASPDSVRDFDDIASALQTAINNAQHNFVLDVTK